MSKTNTFLIGAVVGGIAAGIVTALVTPKNGQSLREDLCEYGTDLKYRGTEILGSMQGVIQEGMVAATNAKNIAIANTESLKERGSDLKVSLQDVVEEGKNVVLKAKSVVVDNKDLLVDVKDDIQASVTKFGKEVAPRAEKLQVEIEEINSSIKELEKTMQPKEEK